MAASTSIACDGRRPVFGAIAAMARAITAAASRPVTRPIAVARRARFGRDRAGAPPRREAGRQVDHTLVALYRSFPTVR